LRKVRKKANKAKTLVRNRTHVLRKGGEITLGRKLTVGADSATARTGNSSDESYNSWAGGRKSLGGKTEGSMQKQAGAEKKRECKARCGLTKVGGGNCRSPGEGA